MHIHRPSNTAPEINKVVPRKRQYFSHYLVYYVNQAERLKLIVKIKKAVSAQTKYLQNRG